MNKKPDMMVTDIYNPDITQARALPLYLSKVRAGFPSPADDYIDQKLDLNDFLIKRPASTFFVKVKGDSMINAGIASGDILIVDRSRDPGNNKIIVAILDGEFTVKRVRKVRDRLYLLAENPDYEPIEITEDRDFEAWGVVLHVIHSV